MTKRQKLMAIACAAEAATGLGLLAAPSMVVRLVLGSDIAGVSIVLANIAGITLIALAIACWPRVEPTASRTPYAAMFVYNLLIALLLAEVAATGTAEGVLLWPVVVLHLVVAVLIPLPSIGGRRESPQHL